MKMTPADNQTCVGDLRLAAIDMGFDPRATGAAVRLPAEFSSVGLDGRDGHRYLIEGTREEMVAAVRAAGYRVAE